MDTIKKGVSQVVNELFQQHKEVKASMLVEAARPKTSPAHAGFEWDNKKAGDEYRLLQARTWIKRVEIVIEDRKERLIHVPIMIDTGKEQDETENREGYYKPISVVANNSSEYNRALKETIKKLEAASLSYSLLKDAAEKKKIQTVNFKKADEGFSMIESAFESEKLDD